MTVESEIAGPTERERELVLKVLNALAFRVHDFDGFALNDVAELLAAYRRETLADPETVLRAAEKLLRGRVYKTALLLGESALEMCDGFDLPADDRDCMEVTLQVLRAYGSPLVMPTSDGVLVCKEGTWAHGKTLAEALEKLGKVVG